MQTNLYIGDQFIGSATVEDFPVVGRSSVTWSDQQIGVRSWSASCSGVIISKEESRHKRNRRWIKAVAQRQGVYRKFGIRELRRFLLS